MTDSQLAVVKKLISALDGTNPLSMSEVEELLTAAKAEFPEEKL